MKTLRWFAVGIATTTLVSTSLASAQAKLDGFAVNSFDPSDRGSDWFSVESLDFSSSLEPTVGFVFDYARNPLVFYKDDEQGAAISNQIYLHMGGRLVLAERVSVGLSMPMVLHHEGDTGQLGGVRYQSESGSAAGDLRLAGNFRLFGTYGEAVTGAAGLQLYLPTGRQEIYASDGSVRAEPRFNIAGDLGALTYAGRVGVQFRPRNENYLDHAFGSSLTFGLAVGMRLLDKKLIIGPELYGTTVVSDGGDEFFEKRTTPVDLLLGGHYMPSESWRLGLGAGPGLTRGWGSPDYRVVASIEFTPRMESPPPQPSDRDNDGIVDDKDACPDVAGVADADPAKNGCPPPADRDGDTVLDDQDACPDVAGPPDPDPAKNGCPPPSDKDGDTILDGDDACPDVAGVASDDPKKHGCPTDKDRDKDGIDNERDACPDQAGPAHPDPKKNGCPKAVVVGSAIQINERVEFDLGKSTIRAESDELLTAVADVLKAHPEIKKLSVEGHTDNSGTHRFNLRLSKERAASVVNWLVRHGVEADRLTSAGYGQDKPADRNDTEEGRQNNRRVEFLIVQRQTIKDEIK